VENRGATHSAATCAFKFCGYMTEPNGTKHPRIQSAPKVFLNVILILVFTNLSEPRHSLLRIL
jgi:hypothetical protein